MKNQSKKIKATYIILLLAMIGIFLATFCIEWIDYGSFLISVCLLPVAMAMCIGGIIIGTTSWKQMLLYLLISMLFCSCAVLLNERFYIARYENFFIGIIEMTKYNLKGIFISNIIFFNGMIAAVIGEVIGKVGNIIYKKQKENQNEN